MLPLRLAAVVAALAALAAVAAPPVRAVRLRTPAARVLGLPAVRRGPVPGYVLIADRNNNRVLLVSPSKRVVWQARRLRGPDDAFFTPGYRSVLTNEEFNDTLTEVALRSHARIWHYGHAQVAGSSRGYLNTPDDAYRLPTGATTIADIRNCRIVELRHTGAVKRILGGSCVHDPPRGFASPNGDTPLPDGGLLVTEIGPPGWIDRLSASGRLLWSLRSPVAYPSDAQLLPNGRILVASFQTPGRIVEVTRRGRVTWSFGAASGPNRLDRPSLAVRWPNGLIAANDDYRHRVIVIDPGTHRIVWQYGHTDVASSAPGYLDKPDGIDLLPASASGRRRSVRRQAARSVRIVRVGTLPRPLSRASAVALPGGRVVVAGGLAGGTSTSDVLAGPPGHLRRVGRLPVPTHDAAAVRVGSAVVLYGGGEAVSTDAIVRVEPRTGAARTAGRLDEPLSDLGAVRVGGRTYLVGGYTGSRYASAVLRVERGGRTAVAARLPHGLRYAGVASAGSTIFVAGGVSTGGETDAVEAVDLRTGRARRIATLPTAIAHAPLVTVGRQLYLVGGTSGAGAPLDSILRIDPATGRVTRVGTLPEPLADSAAIDVRGTVVVVGGAGRTASAAVLAFRP